jgi:hypothetical protein
MLIPGEGHPDRWIYDHLRHIEMALYALVQTARNQSNLAPELEALLRRAHDGLYDVSDHGPQGNPPKL